MCYYHGVLCIVRDGICRASLSAFPATASTRRFEIDSCAISTISTISQIHMQALNCDVRVKHGWLIAQLLPPKKGSVQRLSPRVVSSPESPNNCLSPPAWQLTARPSRQRAHPSCLYSFEKVCCPASLVSQCINDERHGSALSATLVARRRSMIEHQKKCRSLRGVQAARMKSYIIWVSQWANPGSDSSNHHTGASNDEPLF